MKKTYCARLLGVAFLLLLGDGGIRTACAQTTEPILRLEVGTHNAGIFSIAIDPSNRILVTGSEDKTVRVSKYQDSELRLGLAAKDALDFGEVWKGQKGSLYSGVEARVLTDAQATKGNILDGLDWLRRQATSKDVAVLFLAGHGINDPNGVFYFLPVDAKLDSLKRTGLAQADITTTVAAIAGKVIVFIDACHSGNLMEKAKRRASSDISAVINELAGAKEHEPCVPDQTSFIAWAASAAVDPAACRSYPPLSPSRYPILRQQNTIL